MNAIKKILMILLALLTGMIPRSFMDALNVQIERSGAHIHLSEKDKKTLFGDIDLGFEKELQVLGEYATKSFVEVICGKVSLRLRVLASKVARTYSQIEVDATTYFRLFGEVCPRLRMSGDLEGAPKILVIGPCGSVEVAVIVSQPHIHAGAIWIFWRKQWGVETLSGIYIPTVCKKNETVKRKILVHLDAGQDFLMIPR